MRKRQPIVYFLIAAMMLIWGLVIYRIIAASNTPSQVSVTRREIHPAASQSVPKMYKDTFELVVRYPDPFTGEVSKQDTVKHRKVVRNVSVQAAINTVVEINPADEFNYIGFVSGPENKGRIAIVTYRGTEKMMLVGEAFMNVKLTAVTMSEITLRFKNKIKKIKIK